MTCSRCIHKNVCKIIDRISIIEYDNNNCADFFELVRCKDCKHSIKKDYDGVVSYEYLCILKSTVTHLEEHEANYFCADGDRRDTNG